MKKEELIKMLLKTKNKNNVLLCLIKKQKEIKRREFIANCKELELMKSAKFLSLVSMIKDVY